MEKNVDFRLLRINSVTSSNCIFSSRFYNYCDPTSSYNKNYHIMAPSFSIRKFLGDWTLRRRKKIWNGLYRTTCLNRLINKSCNVRTTLKTAVIKFMQELPFNMFIIFNYANFIKQDSKRNAKFTNWIVSRYYWTSLSLSLWLLKII